MPTRFNAEWSTVKKDLHRTAERLGYRSVQILKEKRGEGALVKLVGAGPARRLQCSTFDNHYDNVRAIGLSLEYQRRIRDEYGAEMVRQTAEASVEPSRRLTA